jgi:tetratricopeptide (TPR) repeat protein
MQQQEQKQEISYDSDNNMNHTKSRKRSRSSLETSNEQTGWAGEYGALEHERICKLMSKRDTSFSSSSPSSSTTPPTAVYNVTFLLMSTSRLERLFRKLQNVTKSVAIHVLECVEDDNLFYKCEDEFLEWKVSHVAQQLRHVFLQHGNTSVVTQTKRQRLSEDGQIQREKEFIRDRIAEYLAYLRTLETTSFDDLVQGIVEEFRYHPSVAFKLFHSALEKNRYNYIAYFHAMELFRQSGSKLDCVKELKYGKFLIQEEIAQVELEISVENSRFVESKLIPILEHDLSLLKANDLVFDALIHFFSDGSAEDMYRQFSAALEYDPNCVYAYINLGVLKSFNTSGSNESCFAGLELMEKAVECCREPEMAVVGSFIYHTIAQTYMRLNYLEEALQNIDSALAVNPTMILAYFDKASILRCTGDLQGALVENDALIQIAPECKFERSNIYCNRSVMHYKLNQEQSMYESLKTSVSIDPNNSFPYIMLSKQAMVNNDFATFEKLKDSIVPREHMHITHYLQHLIEAYSHFDMMDQVKKCQDQLCNYEGSWNRID